jgi:two-component system, response regulator
MNGKTILLVEDNPNDELLTLRALRKHDSQADIAVARDGAEALDYLFATGPFAGRDATRGPHLVLLDLKLPKIDGLEVLRRIRQDKRTRLLPVVILTTSVEHKDLLGGYEAGCNSYVRKGVDFAKFASAVSHLGLYWSTVNESPPNIGVE